MNNASDIRNPAVLNTIEVVFASVLFFGGDFVSWGGKHSKVHTKNVMVNAKLTVKENKNPSN